jgi:hypothetical protein
MDLNVKIPEVVFVGNGTDSGYSVVGRVRWVAYKECMWGSRTVRP